MKRTTRASSAAKSGSNAPAKDAGGPPSPSTDKLLDPCPGIPDWRGEGGRGRNGAATANVDTAAGVRGVAGSPLGLFGAGAGTAATPSARARRRQGGGQSSSTAAPAPAGSEGLLAALSPAAAELAAAQAALASTETLVADLRLRLSEAKVALSKGAKRVKEAERWAATEAERAHNAEQPFVLLPDVLQKKIIDLLPIGR